MYQNYLTFCAFSFCSSFHRRDGKCSAAKVPPNRFFWADLTSLQRGQGVTAHRELDRPLPTWGVQWLRRLPSRVRNRSWTNRRFWPAASPGPAARPPSRSCPLPRWSWPTRPSWVAWARARGWILVQRTVCALLTWPAGTCRRPRRSRGDGFLWTLRRRWPSTPRREPGSLLPVRREQECKVGVLLHCLVTKCYFHHFVS